MWRVGFTGTQNGMTEKQLIMLQGLLSNGCDEFHHGDCVGADAQAHRLVTDMDKSPPIFIHPPKDDSKRAFCPTLDERMCEPEEYLKRNHHIVDECDALIATPATNQEVIRSGTWATVRYARTQGKFVTIIPPQGIPPAHS